MTIPSGPPLIWSAVAFGLALLGCFAAIRGWFAISKERLSIRRANIALTADAAWEGAFTSSEVELSKWLRTSGIHLDSCIADSIRACWSAWLGGRATSLTELHVLVARRERARGSASLSAGIAGLLLVVGIVGTLSSVHPILKAFKFQVSASGELQEVAKSTELVNALVNNLGDAFWPSLIALGGTVFVVFCRGCYTLALNQLTLELDRFAISSLIQRYRPSSIFQEYTEVKRIFSELTDSISRREESFGNVVIELKNLVTNIAPTVQGLKATAEKSDKAAKKLSDRSQSIADGITRTLGASSPIYKAISGFEGLFDRTAQAIDSLNSNVLAIGEENRKDRQNLAAVFDNLSEKVGAIALDHKKHKDEFEGVIKQLRTEISGTPKTIVDAASDAVSQGLRHLQSSVDKFRNEYKEEGDQIINEVRQQTAEKLKDLTEACELIPQSAQQLKSLIASKSDVETAAVAAIKKQQNEAEASLVGPIEELKKSASNLETSRKHLMDAAEAASTVIENVKMSVQNLSNQRGLDAGADQNVGGNNRQRLGIKSEWSQNDAVISDASEEGTVKYQHGTSNVVEGFSANQQTEKKKSWFFRLLK